MPHFRQAKAAPVDSASGFETEASLPVVQPCASSSGEQALISKGLVIKGEITGSDPLFIDGKVEGSIILKGNSLTVGRNGVVAAIIDAGDVVVMGQIHGNVTAANRVDIRAGGAVAGDVVAARISIEDGASFKGGIDIRAIPDQAPRPVAVEGSDLAASYDARAEESIFMGRYGTLEEEDDIENVLPKRKSLTLATAPSRARVGTR
jgi:cytoskeletal protein CcmA (bactofilin family)